MKRKSTMIMLVIAASLLLVACSSSSETGQTTSGETVAENPTETPFNLFQSIAQIRADVNPSKAFMDFKNEHLKSDQPVTLQFAVEYIDDRQPGKAAVDLKLAEVP